MSNEFTPDSSHAGICAVRNLSLEMQLERFRVSVKDSIDTPDGWSRRFMAWLGKGRPEPATPPAPSESPPDPPRRGDKIPEWVRGQVEIKRREKRRYEREGRTASAADVQREIDQLLGGREL